MTSPAGVLRVNAASIEFQNPVLLAAGTAAYGREVAGVIDLESLGGIVTKAVSPEERKGAASPRVAEFGGGMMNAVGLANPGLDGVMRQEIPWLQENLVGTRVIVNVVGRVVEDFSIVTEALDRAPRIDGFELNVSCPNVRAGGIEFGSDRDTLVALIAGVRATTRKPLFVKLSPTLSDIAETARAAVDAGADGISVINTMPGLMIDIEARRPVLGFGSGGVSGSAILPAGILAVRKVSRAVAVPVVGIGGISRWSDAIQYIVAGATLVAVGTAALRDPRAPERIVEGMRQWCGKNDIRTVRDVIGTLSWAS